MEKLTCEKAKQIDLVDYLASLGHQPEKIRNNDYWFLSPLRTENTPSFKVNKKLNLWYDHATGKGGDLVNFGTQYFNCSTSDLLERLSRQPDFSFHPQLKTDTQQADVSPLAGEKKEANDKIVVIASRPLTEAGLLQYLKERNISLAVAQSSCREVDFLLYGRQYTVIGFPNNAGGFELRSKEFKGSSSPKDIAFFDSGSNQLAVFEGFFNYLSYREIHKDQPADLTNFLVLNSLSFFEKSRSLMDSYEKTNLYLDRDKGGISCTAQALQWNRHRYTDQSSLYAGRNDLNDWLKNQNKQQEKRRLRPRF
jgi:hypothetical protein